MPTIRVAVMSLRCPLCPLAAGPHAVRSGLISAYGVASLFRDGICAVYITVRPPTPAREPAACAAHHYHICPVPQQYARRTPPKKASQPRDLRRHIPPAHPACACPQARCRKKYVDCGRTSQQPPLQGPGSPQGKRASELAPRRLRTIASMHTCTCKHVRACLCDGDLRGLRRHA